MGLKQKGGLEGPAVWRASPRPGDKCISSGFDWWVPRLNCARFFFPLFPICHACPSAATSIHAGNQTPNKAKPGTTPRHPRFILARAGHRGFATEKRIEPRTRFQRFQRGRSAGFFPPCRGCRPNWAVRFEPLDSQKCMDFPSPSAGAAGASDARALPNSLSGDGPSRRRRASSVRISERATNVDKRDSTP